jgi:protein ImuB
MAAVRQATGSLTRTMVVWVPDWPVTAAATAAGHSPAAPVAVLAKGRVLAASAAARAEGVRRGLKARDAQSRCPELVVLKYDPVIDARAFDPVISCLEALTPGVQVIRPGMCALKARGPSRFYGTEQAAAEKLLDRLETFDVPGGRVGVADGPFAAEQAARSSSARTRVLVIPPGDSASFLAPISVDTLEQPALTDLLRRLGLRSLGAFAQLPATEVLTRFGPDGAFAHRLARGADDRPVVARQVPPELARTIDFEPSVDRVDQVAFSVRAVADEVIGRLAALGLVCTTLRVEIGTESGRIHERDWLHPRWFSATDLVDRVRWQLQGSGTATSELTSPVVRVRLIPEEADPVGAHVDGLWGGGPDERIHRALSRVQSMLGHGAVVSVALGGGRGFLERQTLIPWGDRPVPAHPADAPWPGLAISSQPDLWPMPVPTTVYPEPLPAEVFAADGRLVSVSARGILSGEPDRFRFASSKVAEGNEFHQVVAWAGPWLAEERWWDPAATSRQARFQFVAADGRAWLFTLRQASWQAEAGYD